MIMAWGEFPFEISTFTADSISRTIKPRLAAQPVIGATPLIHRLGPDNPVLKIDAVFFPLHFNRFGMAMSAAIEQAVNDGLSYSLVSSLPIAGRNVFGKWVATDYNVSQEMIGPAGPEKIKATLSLMGEGGSFPLSFSTGF